MGSIIVRRRELRNKYIVTRDRSLELELLRSRRIGRATNFHEWKIFLVDVKKVAVIATGASSALPVSTDETTKLRMVGLEILDEALGRFHYRYEAQGAGPLFVGHVLFFSTLSTELRMGPELATFVATREV